MAKEKAADMILTETTFNLQLGDKTYTLNFGTTSFMRLVAENPKVTNPLTLLEEVSMFEAVPILIESAIKPSERKWKDREELFELYDACEDPAISKVVTAYMSAAGMSAKKLNPVIEAVNELVERNGQK